MSDLLKYITQRKLWRWVIMACSDSRLIWHKKGPDFLWSALPTEKWYGHRRWMASQYTHLASGPWVHFTAPTPYWVYNINYRLVNSYPENMLTLICFEFHTTHSHTNTPIHTQTVWRKVGYLETVTFICMQREERATVSLYSKIAFIH